MQSFFPIKHISLRGPNQDGNVLFLESVPFDYGKALERQAVLTGEYPGREVVIFRTSRRGRSAKRKGQFVLAREQPTDGKSVEPQADLVPINYVIYAIAPTHTLVDDSDREAVDIANENGQEGDPTIGGSH